MCCKRRYDGETSTLSNQLRGLFKGVSGAHVFAFYLMRLHFPSTSPTVKCVTPPCIWLTDITSWSSLWDWTTEVIHIKILLTCHMHARKGSSPPSQPIFQVAIDWIVASDRGPRPFCTLHQREGTRSSVRFLTTLKSRFFSTQSVALSNSSIISMM